MHTYWQNDEGLFEVGYFQPITRDDGDRLFLAYNWNKLAEFKLATQAIQFVSCLNGGAMFIPPEAMPRVVRRKHEDRSAAED
jgi:hypothetical protein